jgi:hypothetical protein
MTAELTSEELAQLTRLMGADAAAHDRDDVAAALSDLRRRLPAMRRAHAELDAADTADAPEDRR